MRMAADRREFRTRMHRRKSARSFFRELQSIAQTFAPTLQQMVVVYFGRLKSRVVLTCASREMWVPIANLAYLSRLVRNSRSQIEANCEGLAHTLSTKLSTTRFSPALSNAI